MAVWPRQALDRVVPLRASGWEVAYDVDFTALPDSGGDFSDGTVSVGGRSWEAANTGNADTFDIDGGTGLRIAPKQSTVFNNTSQTAPYLEVPFQNLIGDYDRHDRLVVLVRVADAALSEDHQGYGLQVGAGAATGGQRVGMLQYVYDSSLWLRCTRYASLGAFSPSEVAMAGESPFIGLGWRAPVAWSVRADVDVLNGGETWPNPRAMTRDTWSFGVGGTTLGSEGLWSSGTDALRLWAERDGASSSFTATFLGLRILIQRWGT